MRPGAARLRPAYSNVIRLGDGGIRTEVAMSTVLLSAVIDSIWGSAGTELSAIWDGLTTEKPLLSESQILPAESETTDRLRFTPSVLLRPSASPYSRTSASPIASFTRLLRLR